MYSEEEQLNSRHLTPLTKTAGRNWQRYLASDSDEDDPFVWTIRDILTLLLIFFILLYTNVSSSQTKSAAVQTASTQTSVLPKPPVDAPSNRLQDDVSRFMATSANQGFSVRWEQKNPVFVLGENITFAKGDAELREDFQPTLKQIAAFIAGNADYRVIVSGHTDNTPITTGTYPSNWELSAARAARVARFLCENGVEPGKMAIHGYAEYKPLFSNNNLQDRQANRRVEIKLGMGTG